MLRHVASERFALPPPVSEDEPGRATSAAPAVTTTPSGSRRGAAHDRDHHLRSAAGPLLASPSGSIRAIGEEPGGQQRTARGPAEGATASAGRGPSSPVDRSDLSEGQVCSATTTCTDQRQLQPEARAPRSPRLPSPEFTSASRAVHERTAGVPAEDGQGSSIGRPRRSRGQPGRGEVRAVQWTGPTYPVDRFPPSEREIGGLRPRRPFRAHAHSPTPQALTSTPPPRCAGSRRGGGGGV